LSVARRFPLLEDLFPDAASKANIGLALNMVSNLEASSKFPNIRFYCLGCNELVTEDPLILTEASNATNGLSHRGRWALDPVV
jgi:hypothetical protein